MKPKRDQKMKYSATQLYQRLIKAGSGKRWATLVSLTLIFFQNLCFGEELNRCTRILQRRPLHASAVESMKRFWEPSQFSDPRNHRASQFRYIVHTIDDFFAGLGPEDLRDRLAANPSLLDQNPLISASLVSELSRFTFAPSGFILRVQPEKIIAVGTTDLFSVLEKDQSGIDLLLFFSTLEESMTPEALLSRTKPGEYNELVIAGGEGVEVIGIVINIQKDGYQGSPHRTETLKRTAQRLDLPVVMLQ